MKTSKSQEQEEKSSFSLSFWEHLMRVLIGNNKNVLFSFSPCRIVNALQLQDFLHKKVRKLPAGITRKVCLGVTTMLKP